MAFVGLGAPVVYLVDAHDVPIRHRTARLAARSIAPALRQKPNPRPDPAHTSPAPAAGPGPDAARRSGRQPSCSTAARSRATVAGAASRGTAPGMGSAYSTSVAMTAHEPVDVSSN
ncbi:hypothetical protein K353_06115 [Kitasatospora sp. SolWspMP-SS2h]|nr:hypothetical protein K353_06115 [Kitasatospora sp. SolWspMP-SS2h]